MLSICSPCRVSCGPGGGRRSDRAQTTVYAAYPSVKRLGCDPSTAPAVDGTRQRKKHQSINAVYLSRLSKSVYSPASNNTPKKTDSRQQSQSKTPTSHQATHHYYHGSNNRFLVPASPRLLAHTPSCSPIISSNLASTPSVFRLGFTGIYPVLHGLFPPSPSLPLLLLSFSPPHPFYLNGRCRSRLCHSSSEQPHAGPSPTRRA
ncbi:hypothetical protein CONLIGDRAFT_368021 [Coniochaeta ligniaria NRRL 30616]|uniref:Uncharacterized protein n=1 Tax=Coniochaeta ligniaria NRRL 30616 TaxID=1408157 RepID=A0A1J7I3R0_9PEZI|nr:hypothetical protein CONLIGDRAFT_368021 [Coniochaeta ligniaria NRRL 30616]